jgi:hypothetical protein
MTITDAVQEAARRSITRYDSFARSVSQQQAPGALSLMFQTAKGPGVAALPIDPPVRWSRERDRVLQATLEQNDMWASAIARAITKQVARGWKVEDTGQSERRARKAQAILNSANKGNGWANFLGQHLMDFLTTDNGAFVEVVWSNPFIYRDTAGRLRPLGSVLTIQHLDSLRCTRLIDDDIVPYADYLLQLYPFLRREEVNSSLFPALYSDLAGRSHLLWRWQVFDVVDMPSARVEHRGTGLCAASRAYRSIFTTTGLERYISEKITGERVLEIHLVNGIGNKQMQEALEGAAAQQRARGMREFRGVVVIPATKMDANLSGYRIPIAEVPDGFSAEGERTEARLKFANAIGIPVRDLEPAPAGLNSGATALLEAERADGAGLSAWAAAISYALNQWVMPGPTEWRWQENTVRDERDAAEVAKTRASTRKVQIDSGEITAQQALQMAVDAGDAPQEFLPTDATPQDELENDEKPEEEREAAEPTQHTAGEADSPEQSAQEASDASRLLPPSQRKADDADDDDAELDAEFAAARSWAVEALREGRE